MRQSIEIVLHVFNMLIVTTSSQSEVLKIFQRLNTMSNLDYDEPCSPNLERRKTNTSKQLMSMLRDLKNMNEETMDAVFSELENLAKGSEQFCDETQLLTCNSNGTCDCANNEFWWITITSIRQENRCLLANGSLCVPPGSIRGIGRKFINTECQAGSQCVMRRDLTSIFKYYEQKCTQHAVVQKLQHQFGGEANARKDREGFLEFVMEKTTEGICVCNSPLHTQITYGEPDSVPNHLLPTSSPPFDEEDNQVSGSRSRSSSISLYLLIFLFYSLLRMHTW